jgi:hypothetical protein
LLFATASLLLIATGCGRGSGDLKGRVTLTAGGKTTTVVMGQVMVVGSDSKAYYSEIGEDGSYQISGIPAGEAKVVVNSPDPRLAAKATAGREPRGDRKPREPAKKADLSKWVAIPEKYNQPDTTNLKVEIRSGENTYNVEMKK